jgi:hypothetical protein
MTGHYPVAYFALAYVGCLLSAAAAWVTHIIVCIKSASYLFLFAGAVLPPIGVIHGYGVWFGVW